MRTPAAAALALSLSASVPANALAEGAASTTTPPPLPASAWDTEMNNVAMFVTGTALVGVGMGGVVTGAIFLRGDSCVPVGPCGNDVDEAFGAVMVGVGVLHLASGLPLLILGAWQVPVEDSEPPVTAAVGLGAARGELRVAF